MPSFETVRIEADAQSPRVARLPLNRPQRPNAISEGMPGDIRAAVDWANGNDHPCQQERHPWAPSTGDVLRWPPCSTAGAAYGYL